MTPFVQAIILANVIIFLLQGIVPGLVQIFGLWPGGTSGVGVLPWSAPWQIITYSFLHADLFHLGFNMLAIWMFGTQIEHVWRSKRLALTYFLAVITGGLCHLFVGAMFGAGGGPVIGASAGVFGILLVYALLFPRNKIMLLIPPIPMPARVFVGLYALAELYMGVTGTQQGVAHFAHLGGLIGGWIGYRYGSKWDRRWGR